MARGTCRCCKNEYTVNANGTMRYHITADSECMDPDDTDSRKCRGAGQPPEGAEPPQDQTGSGYVCRVCHHPVQLTLNGRARSHLDPKTNASCGGGSDWPLWHNGRGEYRDEAPRGEVLPAARPEDLLMDYDPQDPDGPGEEPSDIRPTAREVDDAEKVYGAPDAPDDVMAAAEDILDRAHEYGVQAEPDRLFIAPLSELTEGDLFRRHTSRTPDLVYRVQGGSYGPDGPLTVEAIVVSAGPYGGREGTLTDMTEVVTCTDLNGRPRPRTSPISSAPTGPKPAATAPRSERAGTPTATPTPAPREAPSGRATSSAPTATTDGSTRSAPMPDRLNPVESFFAGASGARGEDEGKYDQYGRYVAKHPSTANETAWTRATTFAKSITDTFTLDQWLRRMTLLGATKRPDLLEEAKGLDVTRDRERLNQICDELKETAGAKVAAEWGTAVHSFTELCDLSSTPRAVLEREVPEQFQPHVAAYLDMLGSTGLRPLSTLIEFSTAVLQYGVMGTSDRCYQVTRPLLLKMPRGDVQLLPGEFVIGDVKTGKDLDYGWQEIAIQLAIYAQGLNTLGTYNWKTGLWNPKPLDDYAEPGTKVRLDVGVIPHLPVDPQSKKKPALYGVDLESGWNAAVLCERVRAWRKVKTLAGPVVVVNGSETAPQSRPPTLQEQAETVTSKAEASAVFQKAVAAKVPRAELDRLVDIMSARIARMAEPGGAKV